MPPTAMLPATWATPRLTLRPFVLADVEDVFGYAVDETWGQYLPVPKPYERRDAQMFVAMQVLADHATAPRWALQHGGHVVGSVELGLDHEAGVASLHYALARAQWGQGLMTEAVRSVVARVWSDLPHVMRIASWADIRNIASWRVMEKCGLQREGIARSCRVIRGERIDDVRYALLRSDVV
jgi:ribosomal-protein-alanine N-acetyltransferase